MKENSRNQRDCIRVAYCLVTLFCAFAVTFLFTENVRAEEVISNATDMTEITGKEAEGKDISDAVITVDKGCVYDGTEQTPGVSVVLAGETLTEGEDYTLFYSDNIKAGSKASVNVNGIGNYAGSAVATFTIERRPVTIVEGSVFLVDRAYDGTRRMALNQDQLKLQGIVPGDDVRMTIDLINPYFNKNQSVNVGRKTRGITKGLQKLNGADAGNYKPGSAFVARGKVTKSAVKNVILKSESAKYTGKPIKITVVSVTDENGRTILKKNYKVTYYRSGKVTKDLTSKGKITVRVTGVGTNYRKYATASFTITSKTVVDSRVDLSSGNVTVGLYNDYYSYLYGYETESVYYDGNAKTPMVVVCNNGSRVFEENNYTVSYSNNVNAGTAKVIVRGIGNYKGTVEKKFTILKRPAYPTVKKFNEKIYVGDTYTLSCEGLYGSVKFYSLNTDIVEVSDSGEVTAINTGTADIYGEATGDANNEGIEKYYIGTCEVTRKKAEAYGFSQSMWRSTGNKYKHNNGTRNADGTARLAVSFTCDAEESWIDNEVRFEFCDVTPKGIKKIFSDMGYTDLTDSLEPKIGSSSVVNYGYRSSVHKPLDENGAVDTSTDAMSGKYITLNVGMDVRVVRVDAIINGVVADRIYLYAGSDEAELEFYAQVRRRVESKLWTDDMTNLQKLDTLATYISSTCHYPGEGCTKKEVNPTLWERYAVDDVDLYYYMCNDPIMNRIIDLQGGIVTCQAASIVERAALEDLGLPYLYDGETGSIAEGEGVWYAVGNASSNPYAGAHESLVYKDADEKRCFIDAQGMLTNSSCEEHGCLERIVPLAEQ